MKSVRKIILSARVSSILALFASVLALIVILRNRRSQLQYVEPSISSTESDKQPSRERDNDRFIWSETYEDWFLARGEDEVTTQANRQVIEPSSLWSNLTLQTGDRIINQLMLSAQTDKIFQIHPSDRFIAAGRDLFIEERCTVSRCAITHDIDKADAFIFPNSDVLEEPPVRKPEHVWIAYLLESPPHTYDKRFARRFRGKHEFNWTATYRSDSDIVTPYAKFVPYADKIEDYHLLKGSMTKTWRKGERLYSEPSEKHKSLIRNKQSRVAWFASNCHAVNSRLEYAKELSKYIPVDIYGKCGNMTCEKHDHKQCLDMLNKKYKFYLSFENSNCREYITEKLYRNAFGYNNPDHLLLPIVMGASKSDYVNLVPPGSFLHVDDFKSAKDLANYLMLLDQNDSLYYSYFQWKTLGHFIDTKFMCRVCAMLHQSHTSARSHHYSDIKGWWSTDICDH